MNNIIKNLKKALDKGLILQSSFDNVQSWLPLMPNWAVLSIKELVDNENFDEINDRFYKLLALGTGGMRGRTIGKISTSIEKGAIGEMGTPEYPAVGTNYLNDFTVAKATIGLFNYCKEFLDNQTNALEEPKIVIACDVRHFSKHFANLSASIWSKLGGVACLFNEPKSTPELSYFVRKLKATAGIVITASHNPSHDNGYKIYFSDGAQVVPPHDKKIIEKVNEVKLEDLVKLLDINLDKVKYISQDLEKDYFQDVLNAVIDSSVIEQNPVKVVFSSVHGTGIVACPKLMKTLGIEPIIVEEQASMDPRFPTVESPNPEYLATLKMASEKMIKENADIMLATDPDADRIALGVNDNGKVILFNGNTTGALLSHYRINKFKQTGLIPENGSLNAAIVKTFVTSPLIDEIAKTHNIKCINALTGFKWIGAKLKKYEDTLQQKLLEEEGIVLDFDKCDYLTKSLLMLKESTFFILGTEESYGYLFTPDARDKDANAACVAICELASYLKSQNISWTSYLDSIYKQYGFFTEKLLNKYYEGAKGALVIKNILSSFRQGTFKELNGVKIKEVLDFKTDDIYDQDGDLIPKEDFLFLKLEEGFSVAVRASGTEPKIKFYIFASSKDTDNLDQTKESLNKKIQSFYEFLSNLCDDLAK